VSTKEQELQTEMQKAIMAELPRFAKGQADQYTLLGAIRLQDDLRATQALLNLIHRGEIVAVPFTDDTSNDEIEWKKVE
jgi:hypothetical protein